MKSLLFLSGLLTLVAQSVLVRQVLAGGGVNELSLGILLGAWLFWIGAGSLAAQHWPAADPARAARQALAAALGYLPALLLQLLGAALLRPLTGTAPGDPFSLPLLVPALAGLTAPVSLVTGFLFVRACTALAGRRTGRATTLGYGLEALGSLAGGAGFTLWILAGGEGLPPLFLAAALLMARAAFLLGRTRKKSLPAGAHGLAAAVALLLALLPAGDWLRRLRFRHLAPGAELLLSRESPAGLLQAARVGPQVVLYQDGELRAALPDREQAALTAGMLLAQIPPGSRILFLGTPSPALVDIFCRGRQKRILQIEEILVVQPDPGRREAIAQVLPGELRQSWLSQEVRWIDQAPRAFLARGDPPGRPFHLVVHDLGRPGRATSGRLVTVEALAGIGRLLAPRGVVALALPLAERALDQEKERLGATLLATTGSLLPRTVLVPGVTAWLLAGGEGARPTADGKAMEKSLAPRKLAALDLPPGSLTSAYDPAQGARLLATLRAAARDLPPNRDDRPTLFFAGLAAEIRYRDESLARVLGALRRAGPTAVLWPLAALLLLAVLRLVAFPPDRRRAARITANTVVGLAGAGSISLFLLLLLAYQCRAGVLFGQVGLASGLFLAGTATAAIAGGRLGRPVLLLTLATGGAGLIALAGPAGLSRSAILALFPLAGAALGCGFPAGATLLARAGTGEEQVAANLESWDHLGAAAGGTLAGTLFIPLLGIGPTLLLVTALQGALLLLLLVRPGRPGTAAARLARRLFPLAAAPSPADHPAPVLGAVRLFMLWSGLSLVGLHLLLAPELAEKRKELPLAAARALEGTRLEPRAEPFPHARVYRGEEPEAVGYLFATRDAAGPVEGYAGPLDLLLLCDRRGIIHHVEVWEWYETPTYVEGVPRWLRQHCLGRPLDQVADLGRGREGKGTAVVTGATITCHALERALAGAARAAAAGLLRGEDLPEKRAPGAAAPLQPAHLFPPLALVAGLLLLFRPSATGRRLLLTLLFLVGGLVLAAQFSPTTAAALLLHWPPADPGLLVLAGSAAAAALLAGPLFCGHLCPFGALQEACSWAGLTRRPPAALDRAGRGLKYLLLYLLLVTTLWRGDLQLLAGDPLAAAFGPSRGTWVWLLLISIVLLALFIYRFWCRWLCPLGALFQLFTCTAPLLRLAPPIRPEKCDTGIDHPARIDCIRCHRCLTAQTTHPAARWRRPLPFAAAAALILLFWGLAVDLPSAGKAGTIAASTLRRPDREQLRKLLDKGDLSDHPAMFSEEEKR